MDGLRWEEEGMKPEGTSRHRVSHAMPCRIARSGTVLTGYCEAGG